MFKKAFLEESGNGRLRHEEQLLRAKFERRGIPVSLYTAKRIHRRQLPLSRETFIAGDMDAMHEAMRQLKIAIPAPNDYPKSLLPFMHRQIWTSTLGAIERRVLEEGGESVFAKPADRRKSFTGRVFTSVDDFRELGSVSVAKTYGALRLLLGRPSIEFTSSVLRLSALTFMQEIRRSPLIRRSSVPRSQRTAPRVSLPQLMQLTLVCSHRGKPHWWKPMMVTPSGHTRFLRPPTRIFYSHAGMSWYQLLPPKTD
jgi:hypothetical protein